MAPSARLTIALGALGLVASTSASGVLNLNLHKKTAIDGVLHPYKGLIKRSGSSVTSDVFDVQPWSLGGAYYTNVTVGTPPQVLTVILDTGSSDLYVDARSASACQSTTALNSCRGGIFDSSSSSTYKVVDQGGFNTTFGDGSTATGDYSTDVVAIGDVSITNVEFGVATFVNSTSGYAVSLLGLGYPAIEAVHNGQAYPNMPSVLVQAGVINSRVYSVFLDQFGTATGNIIFGGVDTSLYTGDLYTLNLLPAAQDQEGQGSVFEFIVAVTGLTITTNGQKKTVFSGGSASGSGGSSYPVLLDTGSAAWTVAPGIYNDIVGAFGNNAFDEDGFLDCSYQNSPISLTVQFGGVVSVNVPVIDLVVPIFDEKTNQPATDNNGNQLCTLMIAPDIDNAGMQSQGFLTLGDAILRSMYVVFDLDNGQVSIAQANTNPSGSNVKIVPAGANGVASAVGSGVMTTASNTNQIGGGFTGGVFSASTISPAVGTATGVNAVPEAGRVTGSAASGATGGSSAASPTSSKGAAAALRPDRSLMSAVGLVAALWTGAMVVGFGLVI